MEQLISLQFNATLGSTQAAYLTTGTWTGTKVVAAGNGGLIMTSEDCRNWTIQNSGTKANIQSVVSANNLVLAFADSAILVSPDGITWSTSYVDSATFYGGGSIVWAGSYFLVLGGADSNKLAALTSTNGTSWKSRTTSYLLPSFPTPSFTSIIWNGTQFLAATCEGGVISSTDGFVWDNVLDHISSGPLGCIRRMAWNGTNFIAISSNDIATSSDGITWTIRISNLEANLSSVFWLGNRYIAVGFPYTLSSTDGINWSMIVNHLSAQYDVVWTGNQFVAFTYAGIFTSPLDNSSVLPRNPAKHNTWGSPEILISRKASLLIADFEGFCNDRDIDASLFSVNGKRVLLSTTRNAFSKFTWDASSLSAGTYLLRAHQGSTTAERLFAIVSNK
jgi:hypothetical protein